MTSGTPPATVQVTTFGVLSVASGGTPIVLGPFSAALPVGVPTTIPAQEFLVSAEVVT